VAATTPTQVSHGLQNCAAQDVCKSSRSGVRLRWQYKSVFLDEELTLRPLGFFQLLILANGRSAASARMLSGSRAFRIDCIILV